MPRQLSKSVQTSPLHPPSPSLPAPKANKALILLAHGSRDPQWRAPFEALAARIASSTTPDQPAPCVQCAYLELCTPDLAQAASTLIQDGAQHITIAPLFLGLGAHARQEVPRLLQALQAQHPQIAFTLLPILGENAAVQTLIADYLLHTLTP